MNAPRLRAALHELRCRACRETWSGWWRRLLGADRPDDDYPLQETYPGSGIYE